MKFPLENFERFCSELIINSKEMGLTRLVWNAPQRYLMEQIAAGLARGSHEFYVLKCRQVGLSTIGLALDLYWTFRFNGTSGAIVTNNEKTRENFRAQIDGYLHALSPAWRRELRTSNRAELRFVNRSRLAWLVAGGRQSGALARGEGLNFLHATEISSWEDTEAVLSLSSALSESHPHRLYLYESTARGYNLWYELWRSAKRNPSVTTVFIPWWRHERYRVERESAFFNRLWTGKLFAEERAWARKLARLYGVELAPEQWAWWRMKVEKTGGNSHDLLAEFPFYDEQAFVLTGEHFFPLEALEALRRLAESSPLPVRFAYEFGAQFSQTRLIESPDGELSVWEQPQAGCDYILAADPAFGESENADCFCVEVFKASLDGLEQVAEYNTPACSMYAFAWVLAHLAGAYGSAGHEPSLILELGGGGRAVLQELLRMPVLYARDFEGEAGRRLADLFGSIQHFLYRRVDSFSSSRLLQWETSWKTKPLMMHALRDNLERNQLIIRSVDWVEQARFVTQNGSRIEAGGGRKDDRIIAAALGVVAWSEQVLPRLLNERGGRDSRAPPSDSHPAERLVHTYLENLVKTVQ